MSAVVIQGAAVVILRAAAVIPGASVNILRAAAVNQPSAVKPYTAAFFLIVVCREFHNCFDDYLKLKFDGVKLQPSAGEINH